MGFKDFFKNQDEITKLKNDMAKKYQRFKRIASQYSCGTNLMLNISSEASTLKREIDEIWKKLQELDPTCPKKDWL